MSGVSDDDRKWGMIAHMSALAGLLLPLGLVLGPLVTWLLKRKESSFVDVQGKSALNFQLTVLLTTFVLMILSAAIDALMILAFLVGVAGLVFAVIAGLKAKDGIDYQYPWSLKLLK